MKLKHADPTGFFSFMQAYVRNLYGAPGKWGHGKYANGTKKGPGRRRLPPEQQNHPSGTKMIRRFIRRGTGENVAYRSMYANLTGKQYGA